MFHLDGDEFHLVHTKKAGLRVAVLISHSLERLFLRNFRFTRLWYCPLFRTSNTEVHAEYVRTRVYLIQVHTAQDIHILRTSIAAMSWNKIEFTRFRKAKNKALRTPFRHKGKVARFDAYILKCRKPYWGLGSNIGFPRGDTSHPLNPDVGLSPTKLQHFFHKCK